MLLSGGWSLQWCAWSWAHWVEIVEMCFCFFFQVGVNMVMFMRLCGNATTKRWLLKHWRLVQSFLPLSCTPTSTPHPPNTSSHTTFYPLLLISWYHFMGWFMHAYNTDGSWLVAGWLRRWTVNPGAKFQLLDATGWRTVQDGCTGRYRMTVHLFSLRAIACVSEK